MKKIPKSITVTVRNGDNFRATRPGRTYRGGGYDHERILGTFPGTPDPPYKLTYSLDPEGPLMVADGDILAPEIYKIIPDKARTQTLICCFMRGLRWGGLRVSRRVEKVA